MPICIGANPIGWSNDDLQDIGGDTPLEVCLAEAREAGFVGMELGHKFPRQPEMLQAALAPFGMACISGWYSAELLKRDADQELLELRPHLDLLKAMGSDVLVCAAGGLPGELHKLWLPGAPGGYHAEYGYSTMGYEIAGGLGVKMADPAREVTVMLGDGSYLMMNSEIATSIMLGLKLTIVLLDNRGFGCIDRLQRATGGASFNNTLATARHQTLPEINFATHAASLGEKG